MIKKRDIVTCILLSIFTCGIYGIYWFIVLTDDVGRVSEDHSISGGMAFVLTLITCGIYGIYWAYKMGKNLYESNAGKEVGISDNSVVYLILQIFSLSIINYCLIQSDLNKIAEK